MMTVAQEVVESLARKIRIEGGAIKVWTPEDAKRLVLCKVVLGSKENPTPVGIIESTSKISEKGKLVIERNGDFDTNHLSYYALVAVCAERETVAIGQVCRVVCRLPGEKRYEEMPGGALIYIRGNKLEGIPQVHRDLMHHLFVRTCEAASDLEQARKDAYRRNLRKYYQIQRLNDEVGYSNALYRIRRWDGRPLTRVDWVAMQRYLGFLDTIPEPTDEPDVFLVNHGGD